MLDEASTTHTHHNTESIGILKLGRAYGLLRIVGQEAAFCARILLVDDDCSTRYILRAVLSKAGCAVQVASCGKEALALLQDKQSDFDAVLTDLRMPEGDGLDILHGLSPSRKLSVPVIVMSVEKAYEAQHQCLNAGAASYIVKPVQSASLLHLLRSLFSSRSAPMANGTLASQLTQQGLLLMHNHMVEMQLLSALPGGGALVPDAERCPPSGLTKLNHSRSRSAFSDFFPQEEEKPLKPVLSTPKVTTAEPAPMPTQHAPGQPQPGLVPVQPVSMPSQPVSMPAPPVSMPSQPLAMPAQPGPVPAQPRLLATQPGAVPAGLDPSGTLQFLPEASSRLEHLPPHPPNPVTSFGAQIPPSLPPYQWQSTAMFNNCPTFFMPFPPPPAPVKFNVASQPPHPCLLPLPSPRAIPPADTASSSSVSTDPGDTASSEYAAQVNRQEEMQLDSYSMKTKRDATRRALALSKFREKRKNLSFEKKVRYVSRKKLAENRPRVRGQFVKRNLPAMEVMLAT
ncbi:hypothetical protein CYMTET_46921 [Cymbomonas tetramitiformis]|uniref:Uncharacterized protein n=2 Tax=Cymbomonas tetramitiformis TaxID=36881 RepID=A0AAE0BWD7_9CHLO|nr:hypothetical protein CYMTET_46921 [Cymbomonas tetramitiformis]